MAADALSLATRDDAGEIARLSRDRIEIGLGWSWTLPRVLRSIRDHETNVVVVRSAVGLHGFGIMKYGVDDAHLLLLAVRVEDERQGLGTALIDWLERSAQVGGVARIGLEARASNAAARAFYARHGYRELQAVAGYYQGREACVRMEKVLRVERAVPG